MTYKTLIRMETTDEIRDGVKRTGDLLNRVIGILGLETKTLKREGDGATVVLSAQTGLKKGSQERVSNKKRAGIFIHPLTILQTNVKSYYSRPTFTRNISSKALNNLELYKNAYETLKSKPGNMTPGTDGQTIDGISERKLIKLIDSIKN